MLEYISTKQNVTNSTSLSTLATSSEVQHATDQFQIAQGYFSNILEAQTAIFSLIVGAIIAFYIFFNWKTSKEHIKKETDLHFVELRKQIQKDFDEKTENLESMFSTGMAQHDTAIGTLRGQTYRTLGQFWDSEKSYATAFLWWFRAASAFASVAEAPLTRICLTGAKRSIERVESGFELRPDDIGEYQGLLTKIDDSYKIEKDLLDIALKAALVREIPKK
ncbi:MAG: hypothetical protein PHS53_00755 [Candidatus Pacebacteria bacterium]|nr:hypothetical protein [Candidatus Paceibacterota bacterium]MDD5356667.1 hypothetical protein [Candidatus Paceibacterota bacterium]